MTKCRRFLWQDRCKWIVIAKGPASFDANGAHVHMRKWTVIERCSVCGDEQTHMIEPEIIPTTISCILCGQRLT